jgi:hypothetical protein
MKVGQLVMLVGCDSFMPPLGTIGWIVGPLDGHGDHEVLFPRWPCPVHEVTWEIPACWLMPVDDGEMPEMLAVADSGNPSF